MSGRLQDQEELVKVLFTCATYPLFASVMLKYKLHKQVCFTHEAKTGPGQEVAPGHQVEEEQVHHLKHSRYHHRHHQEQHHIIHRHHAQQHHLSHKYNLLTTPPMTMARTMRSQRGRPSLEKLSSSSSITSSSGALTSSTSSSSTSSLSLSSSSSFPHNHHHHDNHHNDRHDNDDDHHQCLKIVPTHT